MKRLTCILLVIALLIVGCGSGSSELEPTPTPIETPTPTPVPTPPLNITEYKSMAKEFHTLVCEDMITLISIGELELKLMDLVKNITSNNSLTQKIIDSSYEKCGNEKDFASENEKISEIYKEIILMDTSNNKEAQEIERSIRDSYSGYTNFYKTIFNEGLSYSSYKNNYAKYGTETINALDNLKLFCED